MTDVTYQIFNGCGKVTQTERGDVTNQLAMRALDKKVEAARWANSDPGKKYVHALADIQDSDGRSMAELIVRLPAEGGELFVLASELSDVVFKAAETLPKYTLQDHDLPCPYGFLFMEEPLVFYDSNGRSVVVTALGWMKFTHSPDSSVPGESVAFAAWTDITDKRDAEWDKFPLKELAPKYLHLDMTLVPMLAGLWTLGKELQGPEDHFIYPFMLAFWRFIQEPYVIKAVESAGRHAAKRATRAGQDPTVTVVKLRKRPSVSAPSDHPNPVEWKNRWVVGPFWRNQWYPSLGVHRPKYIMAYIKGPEDKPLKTSSKVNIVDR